jgi:hypothetical protein
MGVCYVGLLLCAWDLNLLVSYTRFFFIATVLSSHLNRNRESKQIQFHVNANKY